MNQLELKFDVILWYRQLADQRQEYVDQRHEWEDKRTDEEKQMEMTRNTIRSLQKDMQKVSILLSHWSNGNIVFSFQGLNFTIIFYSPAGLEPGESH